MKLTFNRKDFLKAVKVGGCYTSGKKVLPVLECIKLTIKGDKCWILSSDERNAIKTYCDVIHSDCDMVFCLNKSDIEKYVSLLIDEMFSIEVEPEHNKVTIETEVSSMVFPYQDANEFLALKQDAHSDVFKMDANLLGYWIKNSTAFLVNDEFQKNHENMHIFIKDGKIEVFSFNHTKMYYDSSDIEYEGELTFGINRNSFVGLSQALDGEEFVTIRNGERYITVIGSKTMLLIRKDEYNILNYHSLLHFKPLFEMEVDKDQLMSVLLRSMNINDKVDSGTLIFAYDETGVTITAESWDKSKKLTERIISVGGNGGKYTQCYGISVTRIAVSAINADTVCLCPTGDKTLLIIKNKEYETENTFVSPYQNV